LQCFFVVENFTANAVSVAIGDNGSRLIFEIWWNFFYDLFSIKNVVDVNSIDSFVSKRNMEEFSVVIMKRFRSNWFEKTKVENLSSPGYSEINVMRLFNTIPRTKRSHGHKRIQHPNVKKSSKPRTLQDTFNDLLSNIQKPLGIHHRWNFFYDLFSIKNVADGNRIDSFVSKRNMEEFSVVIMKRFRSNWFEKTEGRHVT
jgi:hypothetical protein